MTSLIFLVDDDEDNRLLLREAIQPVAKDSIIIEADNGLDFVEKLSQQSGQVVSFVLLDMYMPVMNGLETIHHVKSMPGCEDIPLIMLTNCTNDAIREKALSAGSEMFIIKQHTFNGLVSLAEMLKQQYL